MKARKTIRMRYPTIAQISATALVSCLCLVSDPVEAGTTTRASVDSAGSPGNFNSEFPASSADGRVLAFWSSSSNLVPGDTNGDWDVFMHDRLTGAITRVNVDSAGNQANSGSGDYPPIISLSADGRFVAFSSPASNLVANDTNEREDIFVHDRQTGQTTRVSVDSGGNQGDIQSYAPSISADGRFVAFLSSARNLVPNDTNNRIDVFVHDRFLHETTRVSVDSAGNQSGGASFDSKPSISADGRFVAFDSGSNDLVPGDTAWTDIFVHDRLTGETTRVSVDSDGNQASSLSGTPAISADGRFVAFESVATNLVPGEDAGGNPDIYIHDRYTHKTERISVNSDGQQASNYSLSPSISADGRYVAFWSAATNLALGYTRAGGIFVRDRLTGQTTVASVDSDGNQPNASVSVFSDVSADARVVAFSSSANNLTPGDAGGFYDVFVHDRGAPTPETDPPVRDDAGLITGPSPWATNAIVVTHGWNADADSWVREMVKEQCERLPSPAYDVDVRDGSSERIPPNKATRICHSADWDVWVRDWRSKAATGVIPPNPMQAYSNAISLGEALATDLKPLNYRHIHFIAHSAGSNLIDFATIWLKEWNPPEGSVKPIIHETFLDAYDPVQDVSRYGKRADWSDNYVDTRDAAPAADLLDGTRLFLQNAFNFDVTPNVTPITDGCRIDTAWIPWVCRHSRPYRFYGLSIDSSFVGQSLSDEPLHSVIDPISGTAGVGYPLSVEQGADLNDLHGAFDDGGVMTLNTGVPAGSPLAGVVNFVVSSAISQVIVPTVVGLVDFGLAVDRLFARIGLGSLSSSSTTQSQSASATTASVRVASVTTEPPSWLTASVTTAEATDTLRFNWRFASGGEGFVRIFVDDQLVREMDQRFVPLSSSKPEEIYAGELAPGTHKLAVRLDGFGANPSGFEMTDVQLGTLVVLPDADSDEVADSADNCTNVANPDQRDTNGDGYGNLCDADLNNDGFVNSLDLSAFKSVFFTNNPDADLNGDGIVNSLDLSRFKLLFFKAPGPSGVVP